MPPKHAEKWVKTFVSIRSVGVVVVVVAADGVGECELDGLIDRVVVVVDPEHVVVDDEVAQNGR